MNGSFNIRARRTIGHRPTYVRDKAEAGDWDTCARTDSTMRRVAGIACTQGTGMRRARALAVTAPPPHTFKRARGTAGPRSARVPPSGAP
eukprot:5976213-Prymnesium_polylepis.1